MFIQIIVEENVEAVICASKGIDATFGFQVVGNRDENSARKTEYRCCIECEPDSKCVSSDLF